MQFTCSTIQELESIAEEIVFAFPAQRLFLLKGEMGAGKTTLIKAFCKVLKCESGVSSPTFSLVNEYASTLHKKVFHFDLYRIKNETEALDMGIEDYIDSNFYCFMEWPEKISTLLPANYICISIREENLKRIITLTEKQ